MPSGKPSALTVTDSPARQKTGWTAPELATCSVWFSSFQRAKSMTTYCESSRRSWSASLSMASIAAGAGFCCAAERMMPLTSAAKSAAGAALPLTSPRTMAVWSGPYSRKS